MITLLSAVLILVLLLLFTDPWSKMPNDSRKVVLKEPAQVDSIVVAASFDPVVLVKRQGEWLLYGREKVNQVAVENLLIAAGRLQIHSIESGGSEERETEGWRDIRFFTGGKAVREYRFLPDGENYKIRLRGTSTTYYVSVAGFRDLRLERVFSGHPDHYRQHLLIGLMPSEIREIGIAYPDGSYFRFVQNPQEEITCLPGNQGTRLPDASMNMDAVRRLFSYFTAIRYERRSGIPSDSLLSAPPQATIHVISYDGDSHSLQVFPYPEEPGGVPRVFEALAVYNQEPEALVINYIYLDVLMRGIAHYFGGKR